MNTSFRGCLHRRKMEKLFSMIQGYTFQGHTHAPGVFSTNMQFARPDEFDYKLSLPDDKAMINVGSVGHPRDGELAQLLLDP